MTSPTSLSHPGSIHEQIRPSQWHGVRRSAVHVAVIECAAFGRAEHRGRSARVHWPTRPVRDRVTPGHGRVRL